MQSQELNLRRMQCIGLYPELPSPIFVGSPHPCFLSFSPVRSLQIAQIFEIKKNLPFFSAKNRAHLQNPNESIPNIFFRHSNIVKSVSKKQSSAREKHNTWAGEGKSWRTINLAAFKTTLCLWCLLWDCSAVSCAKCNSSSPSSCSNLRKET